MVTQVIQIAKSIAEFGWTNRNLAGLSVCYRATGREMLVAPQK
jgi:hypothetical protein